METIESPEIIGGILITNTHVGVRMIASTGMY